MCKELGYTLDRSRRPKLPSGRLPCFPKTVYCDGKEEALSLCIVKDGFVEEEKKGISLACNDIGELKYLSSKRVEFCT